MAINVYGLAPDIDQVRWSQLFAASMATAPAREAVESGLLVTATGSVGGKAAVSISAGRATAAGALAISDSAITMTVDAASAGMGRVDLLCLEINFVETTVTTAGGFVVLKGAPAAGDSAIAPTPAREAGVLWQIPLAEIETFAGDGATMTNARIKRVAAVMDTGWVATTPAGGWSRHAVQGLAVRRKGGGPIHLNGRLVRDGSNIAIGVTNTFGGMALIPRGFRPERDIFIPVFWDIGQTPRMGQMRIEPGGFATFTPITGAITTPDTVRVHTSWEI